MSRGTLTSLNQSTSSPWVFGFVLRQRDTLGETVAAASLRVSVVCVYTLFCSLLNMRPSHVNWQKICRLDRYPHCPGGKHGEGGLRRVHPRWSGTRGPHGEGEGEDFPWLPRTSRSGRKQKQWETGLTCRERSPRYGATLEPGDVPPDCEEARGGGVRVGFGARRALTHPVAGGTDDPELSSETFFSLFQGMWEARFQPGWIWFLRICANRKRGRKPDDESCLSKLHCGSGYCRVRFQPWALHGVIQYSKCRPQWRKKNCG